MATAGGDRARLAFGLGSAVRGAGRTSDRPRLTAACERVLLRVATGRHPEGEPTPLPRVPNRLLMVKVHGMGDSVMIRSLLDQLCARHPGMETGVMAGPATHEIMSLGSCFRVHSYKQKGLSVSSILQSAAELRRCRYEAVLNFEQGSLAGTAFLWAAGIPVRIGFLPLHDSTKAAFLTMPLRLREEDSMWTSFTRAVRLVDAGFPETPPLEPLPVGEEARRFARAWLRDKAGGTAGPRVGFHVGSGAGQPFRRWPVDRFVALGERLRAEAPDLAVILTGTAPERSLVSAFASSYSGLAVDGTALGSVERTAAVLAECDLLVSNDTGVMHLGAAMGTPTVGIFGPGSPAQWAPAGPRAIAVAAHGVPCSPCSDTYRLKVPRACVNPDQIRCLRAVGVEDVLAAARKVVVGAWLGAPT